MKNIKCICNTAPKLISPYNTNELSEALVYFTTALDEAIDAVFLADSDPGFLTKERSEDLRLLQNAALIVTEAVSLQMAKSECA